MTVLPIIFACDNVGEPNIVVRGTSLAYSVITLGEKEQLEIIGDCLPPLAHVTTRKELAEVDQFILRGGWSQFLCTAAL